MKKWLKTVCAAAFAALVLPGAAVQAQETVKIGVLHSLSGTVAISETSLKDVVLMAVAIPPSPRGS